MNASAPPRKLLLTVADQPEPPDDPSPAPGDLEPNQGVTGRVKGVSPLVLTLIAALILSVLAMGTYALQLKSGGWGVFASAVMFAAAAVAAGGLIGLLFGVPRTVDRQPAPPAVEGAQATPSVAAGVGANTNLEQISDWLTKIIVGVGLVQLGTIKSGAAQLFGNMAASLGGEPVGAPFAGAIVIYFFVFGFFSGWLFARLRLGVAMSNADALISLARRAERAGDKVTAEAAREALATSVVSLAPGSVSPVGEDRLRTLAARYEELRATVPSGPSRTAQMSDLVRSGREMAQPGAFTHEDVRRTFESGTEGRRIMALALMEGDVSLADFDTVLQAITDSRSAFEQYVALGVANLMLSNLDPGQRTKLTEAIEKASVREQMTGDPSRERMADRILSRLRPG